MNVLLIHDSGLCSLIYAGKKILPLLCISLEICLYKPRCLAVYLQLPTSNCVTARWEQSSALFSSSTEISVSLEHRNLTGLSPHHNIFHTSVFRSARIPDCTYPSTALRLFPEIRSCRVGKNYCVHFSKTRKKYSIRNYGINFWTAFLWDIDLWNNNKVRFLAKTLFPNWDKHGQDVRGGKEEYLGKRNVGFFQNAALFLNSRAKPVPYTAPSWSSADSGIFSWFSEKLGRAGLLCCSKPFVTTSSEKWNLESCVTWEPQSLH